MAQDVDGGTAGPCKCGGASPVGYPNNEAIEMPERLLGGSIAPVQHHERPVVPLLAEADDALAQIASVSTDTLNHDADVFHAHIIPYHCTICNRHCNLYKGNEDGFLVKYWCAFAA